MAASRLPRRTPTPRWTRAIIAADGLLGLYLRMLEPLLSRRLRRQHYRVLEALRSAAHGPVPAPLVLRELKRTREALTATRHSHAVFLRGVKKMLGLETWPKIEGDFVEGVLELLRKRLRQDV